MYKWAHEIPMKLSGKAFNKRAQEVFLPEDETVYTAIETDGTKATVYGTELCCSDGQRKAYHPLGFQCVFDMSSRPQALDYLLGNRDDFND